MKKDQNTKKVYTRIPEELDKRFRIACAVKGINRPTGFAQAIKAWVGAIGANPEVTQAPLPEARKAQKRNSVAL